VHSLFFYLSSIFKFRATVDVILDRGRARQAAIVILFFFYFVFSSLVHARPSIGSHPGTRAATAARHRHFAQLKDIIHCTYRYLTN
jgi:hypothetical protein